MVLSATKIIDGHDHLLGRLASVVAKELLSGQSIVIHYLFCSVNQDGRLGCPLSTSAPTSPFLVTSERQKRTKLDLFFSSDDLRVELLAGLPFFFKVY
jgi:hypothetical protein